MNRTIATAMLLVLPGAASSFTLPGSEEDAQAAIRTRRAASVAAINRGEYEQAAALTTEDAAFLVDKSPLLEGRAALLGVLQEVRRRGSHRELEMEALRLEVSGTLGYEIGRCCFRVQAQPGDPVGIVAGKYVDVWRREPDGQWRIAVHAPSEDPALPGASPSS